MSQQNADSSGGDATVVPAENAASQAKPQSSSRRRFLLGGVIAAPAMLTLSGRSALANHCTVSGMNSANLSNHHDAMCESLSIQFWRANPSSWPAYTAGPCNPMSVQSSFFGCADYSEPNDAELAEGVKRKLITEHEARICKSSRRGTRCAEVFGRGLVDPENLTLMQALWLEGNGKSPLIAHAVAALLNSHMYGKEKFGYDPDELVEYVRGRLRSDSHWALLEDLERLNGRGRA